MRSATTPAPSFSSVSARARSPLIPPPGTFLSSLPPPHFRTRFRPRRVFLARVGRLVFHALADVTQEVNSSDRDPLRHVKVSVVIKTGVVNLERLAPTQVEVTDKVEL